MVAINGSKVDARKVPAAIKRQPGYSGSGEYRIMRSKAGDARLYRLVSYKWMDASLAGDSELEPYIDADYEAVRTAAAALRAIPSERRTAQSRENGKQGGRPYTYMLVERITGRVVSRHAGEEVARRAWRKADSGAKPVEVRDYSEAYWTEMK